MNLNKLIIAISLISLMLYFSCERISVLLVGFLCVYAISYIKNNKNNQIESFFIPSGEGSETLHKTAPTQQNPLMNVMPTDNPKRPEAEKSFIPSVEKDINELVKKNINKDIFRDLGDTMELDYSMRNFYSTASTTVPNDQKSFSKFLYGDMPSGKDGSIIACEKNIM